MSYVRIKVGKKEAPDWSDIQQRIDWLLKQKIPFERMTYDGPCIANQHKPGYVVYFTFENKRDAMFFKLAWGGK